ncbi:MAG: hypothetical protein COB53_08705 [Elusimicrobia bacterium]|nr:MAG: hypothetical protein COB53_08705 [Elusimicrobiota bacterium]
MKTLKILFVGLLAFSFVTDANALFGFGRKKKKKDKGSMDLPGLGTPRSNPSAPPRMAQEADGMGQSNYSETETAIGDYPNQETPGGGLPSEIEIRSGNKRGLQKPPLRIEVDAFDSIRDSLKPDQQLLLAESPLTVVWRRTHPEFLRNTRVIKPSISTFDERPGIIFSPLVRLQEVLSRKPEKRELRGFQWSLTIADEEGKVFQHYEGNSFPPSELVWSGQNDQGDWIQAGRAYSPVYMFTDPNGTPYTKVGQPLQFKGMVHQERDGLHLSLDSASLFGSAKSAQKLTGDGPRIIRSAGDLIKRRYSGIPIRVEVYAGSKSLADLQADLVESRLTQHLMLMPQDISTDSLRVSYTDQRVEIILLNR